jgi:hypothetical protein
MLIYLSQRFESEPVCRDDKRCMTPMTKQELGSIKMMQLWTAAHNLDIPTPLDMRSDSTNRRLNE